MITLPEPWPVNPWRTSFRTVRVSDPGDLPAGLSFLTVQSPALGGRGELALYVPAALGDRVGDAPLVILLHGVYGSFWNWSLNGRVHRVLDDLIDIGDVAPMVVAMPSDGLAGEGTAYLDHGHADFERWVIDEVPHIVREAVPATGDSSPVALGGNSMGAFAALRLTARHTDRIAAAAGLSAITDLDDLAAFTIDDIGEAAGVDPALRSLTSVIAPHAASMPPLRFDCGTDDPLIDANRALHHDLDRLGVAHTYQEYQGAHSWDCWHGRIGTSLQFFDRVFRSAHHVPEATR